MGMIYIPGIFIVAIGLIQLFRLYQNSKRLKVNAKIDNLLDMHLKQDKNKKFRTQPHAKVSYMIDGKHYKASVLHKDKTKAIGDTVTLSYYNSDKTNVEMFVPRAEFLMASIITLIGVIILVISYFTKVYFDL